MRKVGVELAINGQTLCVLAGELDNENSWDEISETEFRSNILKDLTVEIGSTLYNRGELTYVYTVKNTDSLQVCFLDLETGNHLCDYIPLQKLLNINNTENIKVTYEGADTIVISILNEAVTIKEIKLISFKNKKSIIQIIM